MKKQALLLLMVLLSGCQVNSTQIITQTPQVVTAIPQDIQTSTPTPIPFLEASQKITVENADKIVELARIGDGIVIDIAYSPTGDSFAIATSIGVYLFDSSSLEQIYLMETESPVNSIAYSSNGENLAYALDDKTVLIWDVINQQIITTLSDFPNSVENLSFSTNGKFLAVLSSTFVYSQDTTYTKYMIYLWDVEDYSLITILESIGIVGTASLLISPDDNLIVLGTNMSYLFTWDLQDNYSRHLTHLEITQGYDQNKNSFAFSKDGKSLGLSGYNNIGIINFDYDSINNDQVNYSNRFHIDTDISSVIFSPDDKLFIAGLTDGNIKMWNLEGNEINQYPNAHNSPIIKLIFSPDGNTLISASEDMVKLWNIENNQCIHTILMSSGKVRDLEISSNGKTLASTVIIPGSQNESFIEYWDLENGTLVNNNNSNFSFSVDKEPFEISTKTSDFSIELWDRESGNLLHTYNNSISSDRWKNNPIDIAFSKDNEIMVVLTQMGYLRIWNVESEQLTQTIELHQYPELFLTDGNIDLSKDGRIITIAGDLLYPQTFALWDIENKSLLRILLSGHTSSVTSAVFSPDEKFILSSSEDGTIKIWGVPNDE